ncbi:methyltransferase [Nocardia sp. CA-129566]|uniref:methyltransferase n=1 Tax=Nocardia sp. CA-129566 TaxID=3239976 RepID=UPI003D974E4F
MDLSEQPVEVQLEILLENHYRFQFLVTACQVGLFAALEKEPGLPVRDVAARVGLQEQPTRILMLGCTAIGLLRKDGESYFNTPLTKAVSGNFDGTPAAFITRENRRIYRALMWFPEAVKENTNVGLQREVEGASPTLYGRITENSELEAEFHAQMSFTSFLVRDEIRQKIDLSEHKHLLDVGGGTAVNAENLASRWPDLRITIADLPSVAATANERIQKLGLADRIQAVGIDALNDEFPTGCDALLFAHFLEIWSPDHIRTLLSKAFRALPQGGEIFVITPYQNDDETGPVRAAYLSAYFLAFASGEGMVYTGKEYETWLAEAGFEPTERVPLGADTILIRARKTS